MFGLGEAGTFKGAGPIVGTTGVGEVKYVYEEREGSWADSGLVAERMKDLLGFTDRSFELMDSYSVISADADGAQSIYICIVRDVTR